MTSDAFKALMGSSNNQIITAPDTEAINRLGTGEAVAVDRSVLEEALEQIEETHIDRDDLCRACDGSLDAVTMQWQHRPDCRYKRVTEALRKVLG